MRTLKACLCFSICLLPQIGTARADILNVPGQYATLQAAIDAASSGDEIVIAAVTLSDCTHMANPPADSTLCCAKLKSGLTITGAGIDQTFIDADSTGRAFYVADCEDVEIRNLTITRAFAETHGAGILCLRSSPYIHHVKLVSNYDGAIICLEGSNPEITFTTMIDNEAKAGGGLDADNTSAPFLYECEILNNRAPFAAGVRMHGSATLVSCDIIGNETVGATNVLGGGILISSGANPLISSCTIANNVCYGEGGGVCIMDAFGEIRSTRIYGNRSTSLEGRGGGVFIGSDAAPEFEACLIANNNTTGEYSDGGGLWVQYANLEMNYCTFYGNWTEGVGPDYGICGNLGIETSMFVPGTVNVHHCIMAFSSAGRGLYCTGTGDEPSIGCCCVYGNAGGDDICGMGEGNFVQDPLFCDPGAMNFHINANSPCAPGNHPGSPPPCELLIGAYGVGCDMGADEPLAVSAFKLANEPNPFAGTTAILFELPEATHVALEIFDLSGRRVATLEDGPMTAGAHRTVWDGQTLSGERAVAGVYYYQLRAGGEVASRRMLRLQ